MTFNPGETRKCTDFTIVNDEVFEEVEEFRVRIDQASPNSVVIGEIPVGTVTIADDDGKQNKICIL